MLGMDPLAVELFQLFLSTISFKHPPAVFTNMRNYMTWMIEQSHDVSTELLLPLLEGVKMENQDVLPHSWKLGEEVLRNSAAKVKPYLKEVVKSLKLNLDDYAEIVKSICQDASSAEIMVKEDLTDGENANVLEGAYYMKDRDLDYQIEHGENGTLSNFEVENSTYVGEDESEMEAEVSGRMQDTEMTINLEPDYDSSWSNRGESSSVPLDNENEEIEISNLLMELVAQGARPQAIMDHNEFIQTPSNDNNLGASIVFENYQRMDTQEMRESMVNQSDGLQLLLGAASFLDMVIR